MTLKVGDFQDQFREDRHWRFPGCSASNHVQPEAPIWGSPTMQERVNGPRNSNNVAHAKVDSANFTTMQFNSSPSPSRRFFMRRLVVVDLAHVFYLSKRLEYDGCHGTSAASGRTSPLLIACQTRMEGQQSENPSVVCLLTAQRPASRDWSFQMLCKSSWPPR